MNFEIDRIARGVVAEARVTDEAEDELHGEARGDELPRSCARRRAGASSFAEPGNNGASGRTLG